MFGEWLTIMTGFISYIDNLEFFASISWSTTSVEDKSNMLQKEMVIDRSFMKM